MRGSIRFYTFYAKSESNEHMYNDRNISSQRYRYMNLLKAPEDDTNCEI